MICCTHMRVDLRIKVEAQINHLDSTTYHIFENLDGLFSFLFHKWGFLDIHLISHYTKLYWSMTVTLFYCIFIVIFIPLLFETIICAFSPIKLVTIWTLKSISFHYEEEVGDVTIFYGEILHSPALNGWVGPVHVTWP